MNGYTGVCFNIVFNVNTVTSCVSRIYLDRRCAFRTISATRTLLTADEWATIKRPEYDVFPYVVRVIQAVLTRTVVINTGKIKAVR